LSAAAARWYRSIVQRDRPLPGGKLECGVLAAVWDGGTLTVRELHQRVGIPLGLVYTTTARVLDRLLAKGLVEREKAGKVFLYRAAASAPRGEIDRARLAQTLSSVLVGRARPALAALVEVIDEIDPALLDDLTQTIEARRSSRG
jgi:predicted transcriptional regulator